MSTLVLSVVGGLVGGAIAGPGGYALGYAIGSSIGAAAGSYIDSQIFATKPPNIMGPRIEDLKQVASTYGNAIPIAYGNAVRTGCNIIWATDLIETANVTKVKSGGKGDMFGGKKQTSTTYTYSISFAAALGEGPIAGIRKIWGDGKLWYNVAEATPQVLANDVRVYLGSESQMPDSLITAARGASATPAYRGIAYILVENLQLANFGNRLPRIEIEWLPGGHSLSGAISAMAGRVGISTMDVASITNSLPGYVVARPTTAKSAIEELMTAYSLNGASLPGGVQVKPRGVAAGGGFDHEMLGTGSERPMQGDPWKMTRSQQTDVPREVNLAFMDNSRDYQMSAVRAQREDGTGEGAISHNLAVVLSPDEAKARAEQIHVDMLTSRNTAEGLMLPPSFSQLNAGDSLDVKIDDVWRRLSIVKATVGANSLVDISATEELSGTWLPYVAIAEQPAVPVQVIPKIVPSTLYLLDIPILFSDDDDAGFYWAIGGDAGWRSAALLRSSDDVNFSSLSYQNVGSVIGTCSTTLADGPWEFIDEGNTLTVVLLNDLDTLETVTDVELFEGANGCLVGNEIIQFRTATLTAPGTYVLSGLVRGRMGTDHRTSTHTASERFIFLDDGYKVERISDSLTLRNALRYYKGVSLWQDATDVTSQSFTNTCIGLQPLSPVYVEGERDGSSNLTITWIRRTRIPSTLADGVDAPLGEASEAYEVDIYSGATVVRTITGLSSETATYSAADQTTDFGSPQASISIRVYQLSANVGRGQYRAATV
jgi:hypothetical protein